jgi:hypothetical protein
MTWYLRCALFLNAFLLSVLESLITSTRWKLIPIGHSRSIWLFEVVWTRGDRRRGLERKTGTFIGRIGAVD